MATHALETPFFGIGAGMTSASDFRVLTGDASFPQSVGHAHNVFLQIWLELGELMPRRRNLTKSMWRKVRDVCWWEHQLGWPALRDRLLGLPRYSKRALLVAIDFSSLVAVLWLGLSLRYRTAYVPPGPIELLLPLLAAAITIATYSWFGLYRLVTRFIGRRGIWR